MRFQQSVERLLVHRDPCFGLREYGSPLHEPRGHLRAFCGVFNAKGSQNLSFSATGLQEALLGILGGIQV